MPRSGHPFQRDVINVTAARLIHFLDAFFGAVRGQQKNRIYAPLFKQRDTVIRLFRRQIYSQYTIDINPLRGIGEIFITHRFDRV